MTAACRMLRASDPQRAMREQQAQRLAPRHYEAA